MTRRVALYARFSSDRQHERSVLDQLADCRRRVAQNGDVVVAEYTDQALSGSHLLSRPGVTALLAAAEARGCDVVMAEALDRLSRDQADTATLYKRLAFAGVAIETLSEGAVNELHVGLRGTMNALYLKDLADKIRRGQRGQVQRGRSAGGLAYGYRVVRQFDERGEPIRGLREIDPDRAAIVRRIYEEYAAGDSARAIAARLNAEGVPPPRGARWNASTINGARGRASGILQNPVYAGQVIWNRVRMLKNPETGRRISRVNAGDAQVVHVDESLRIVSDTLWEKVRRIKAARGHWPAEVNRRPKRLLSGLVRCGECGGNYIVRDAKRMICGRHREAHSCTNGTTVVTADVERRVMVGLQERLVAPGILAEAFKTYRAERKKLASARRANAVRGRRELIALDARIGRLVEAIADGTDSPATRRLLLELEARKARLERELPAAADADVVELHPNFPEAYRRRVAELEQALADDGPNRARALAIIRSLIDVVVVSPRPGRGAYELELRGRIDKVLALVKGEDPAPEVGVSMVAEEGFEPPTHGL